MASQTENIELMRLLLRWEGRLNNGRLRALFGLGQIRASEWIRAFRDKYPSWTTWNNKTRSFHATADVYLGRDQVDIEPSLAQYLALTGIATHAGESPSHPIVWEAFPDISAPSPRIFADLHEAIRTRCMVTITYRSMGEPTPHKRDIAPHSLVRAGRRWHVRAYCELREDFRDYVLGRIVAMDKLDRSAPKDEKDDIRWITRVPVRLIAHPVLSRDQAAVIQYEFFNNTAARVDTCRGALIGYYLQDVRAALDPDTQRPPDYQLAVENIEEVSPWLFPQG